MNVFEDLVIELQEENLLESTFVDSKERVREDDAASFDAPNTDSNTGPVPADFHVDAIHETEDPPTAVEPELPSQNKRSTANKEFFKKKAVGEVSSLQMVEHVITGVEREYMKVVPKTFDDFAAKKALNLFINADEGVESEEHATAEFNLMQETEAWCSALATRDQNVPVSALRQYCERSRPALSSQALLALGRFYRNLPYSETVRSKFDFVITRLFSRPMDQEKRVCLFNREEMLGHINTLYSDWSSIPLYDVGDDDNRVMLTALSFEDLAIEAENAASFDQLVESDFFGRLRMFKESISELFYAPQVTAAAIDCNIRIGNTYVDLIERERQKLDSNSVQNKYGNHDLAISDVTGKTMQLADLLRELDSIPRDEIEPRVQHAETVEDDPSPARPAKEKKKKVKSAASDDTFIGRMKANVFAMNKWLLICSAFMIAASVGLYVWANYGAEEKVSTVGVKVFEVENTSLRAYAKTARISGEMFYVQMLPSWDHATKEKKQEIMQQVLKVAQENGCTQATILSSTGRNSGYISAARLDIANN